MNATEISSTANPRLSRIQTASRIFRYVVLANLVFNVGFWLLMLPSSIENGTGMTMRGLFVNASLLLMFFWFWKLAQLFRFYERGQIFAAETIRCIKVLGMICVIGWMTLVAIRFTPRSAALVPNPPAGNQVVKTGSVVKATTITTEHHYLRMGFFSFDFGTGIDFGTLFVGASVILAAWIMDEGRKIQEEQELTV